MGTQTKMTTCGHCAFGGHHNTCPSGVRNGDGSIHLCGCKAEGCRAGQRRCTDCNNWTQDEIGPDWHCLNKNDCLAEQERRYATNPTMKWLRDWREQQRSQKAVRSFSEEREALEAPAYRARPSRVPSAAPRDCTCGCGGQTKGGRFLPGHDSKYLNYLVAQSDKGLGESALALAAQVSEAFAAKLAKRVSA